jgi:hypothetical protein
MNNLLWFSRWYSYQVSNGIGKTVKVNISSEKKSSWKIKIDLKNTEFRKLSFKSQYYAKSEFNWYSLSIKNKVFVAEGDFTKLDFLIGKFRELIGESKHKSNVTYKEDYFLSEEIKDFLFEGEKHVRFFLHYTAQKENADKILKNGLFYTYAFDKTATPVKNNSVDLNYIHYVRKQFGDYIVVIGFSKKLYDKYIEIINKLNANILRVEEILCEQPIVKNDDDELIYVLSNKFIKGYCNYKTGKIVPNPEYNPNFDSEIFIENIKMFVNN